MLVLINIMSAVCLGERLFYLHSGVVGYACLEMACLY